jgi:hypothetical protein
MMRELVVCPDLTALRVRSQVGPCCGAFGIERGSRIDVLLRR